MSGGTVSRRVNNLHRNITVTPFLNKLYSMVDDTTNDDLIRWSDDGNSFVVNNYQVFAKDVLPKFFKHGNFSSFVRQLNMYGFHKVPHLQQGGLMADDPEAESWEFNNENFQRGQPDLMHFIRRKKGNRDSILEADAGAASNADDALDAADNPAEDDPTEDAMDVEGPGEARRIMAPPGPSSAAEGPASASASASAAAPASARSRSSRNPPVNLAKILKEIKVIRDHQMTISSDIKRLQADNNALWMQSAQNEERYAKHQATIDKILRFLATLFAADARQSEIQLPLRRLISLEGFDDFDPSSSSTSATDSNRTNIRAEPNSSRAKAKGASRQYRSHPYQPKPSVSSVNSKVYNNMATPWTNAIFEEMDFPETVSPGKDTRQKQKQPMPPAAKKVRTGSSSQSSRIFELPSNVTSPAESTGQRTPRQENIDKQQSSMANADSLTGASSTNPLLTAAAGGTINDFSIGQAGSADDASSHFDLLQTASTGSSSAISSNGLANALTLPHQSNLLSRLSAHVESIDRISQEAESAGYSIENLLRMLGPANSSNPTDYLSSAEALLSNFSETPAAAAAATAATPATTATAIPSAPMAPSTIVSSAIGVADTLGLVGLPHTAVSGTEGIGNLAATPDLNSLVMSLSGSGISPAVTNGIAGSIAGASAVAAGTDSMAHIAGTDTGIGSVLGGLGPVSSQSAASLTSVPLKPAPVVSASASVAIPSSSSAAAGAHDFYGGIPGVNGSFNAQSIIDILRSLTPEQQQSVYNYYKYSNGGMPLLTAGPSSGGDIAADIGGSSGITTGVSDITTPFLEFVDPTVAEPPTALDSGSMGTDPLVSTTADVDNVYAGLFKDSLGDIDVNSMDPQLAASLFHTAMKTTTPPMVAKTTGAGSPLGSKKPSQRKAGS
ncbi:Heat shock transcription factor [Coemansia sp. Benny D115]|nr:Heat shock transcription factor [Coemansia sp. Benny D115]